MFIYGKFFFSSDGMDADLDAVEIRTEKLSNEGAKHRISVKPKSRRASTKTSMRQKEVIHGAREGLG